MCREVTKHVLAVLVAVAEYQSSCGKKKGSEKMTPNLFDYATKELSQDAFLCWLLAWADEECRDADSTLHALGLSLLNRVLGLHGKAQRECVTVRVHRQLLRADIVAEVGSDTVLLIEDKVHAGLHGDQLERYRREMEKEFGGRELLPVFVKTGDQSSYEEAERSGYRLLLREHILDLLRPWRDRTSNAIFADFLANLESREALVESYATTPVAQWTKQWDPWIGFYKRLQRELRDREFVWNYVPNASGGFVGAWWHFVKWTDPNGRARNVYLQIEQGPLCFKIEVDDVDVNDAQRAGLRDDWCGRILEKAKEAGVAAMRPAKMGSGTWMTVAKVELGDWMAVRPDGLLDLAATLTKLGEAAMIVDRAASTPRP